MKVWIEELKDAVLFLLIGLVIGIAQLLNGKEKLTPRIVFGRALSTGGIAMAAGLSGIWLPDISLTAQIGVAAALASLGTSALERLFQKWVGGGA